MICYRIPGSLRPKMMVLLFIGLPALCTAQGKTNIFGQVLKGKVSRLTEKTYFGSDSSEQEYLFNQRDQPIESIYSGGTTRWEYDSHGDLVKEVSSHYMTGGHSSWSCTYYQYDWEHRKKEVWMQNMTGPTRTVYRYNDDGRLIEMNKYPFVGRFPACDGGDTLTVSSIDNYLRAGTGECTEYEYDADGRMIKETVCSVGGLNGDPYITEVLNTTRYKYDKGHKVEEDASIGKNTGYSSIIWKYDAAGNKTEERRYNEPSHELTDLPRQFTYNAQGELTSTTVLNKEGSVLTRESYTYDNYDKYGNWHKKTARDETKVYWVVERKIHYY